MTSHSEKFSRCACLPFSPFLKYIALFSLKNTCANRVVFIPLRPLFKKVSTFFHNRLIMRHYEVTFIVDPVLSGDEVKSAAEHIQSELKGFGAQIIAVDAIGLQQLAYSINKRSSGVYYSVEFATEAANWLTKFELNMKRNERLLRFLTIKLDKYGVKYNDDKRNGRIGSRKKKSATTAAPVTAPAAEEVVPAPAVVDLDA
jgi:small subunit ribosomal protein S6